MESSECGASDVVCAPWACLLVSCNLPLWDILNCRLVARRWRQAFLQAIPSITVTVQKLAPEQVPSQLVHCARQLTLLLDDSRLESAGTQQGTDLWQGLQHAVQSSHHATSIRKLRLHFHAALALQYHILGALDMVHTSVWAERLAQCWPELLRPLKTLEVVGAVKGRVMKAPVLGAVLQPCTGLTSLTLQLSSMDTGMWASISGLAHLQSLSLHWASGLGPLAEYPELAGQQQQQTPGLSSTNSTCFCLWPTASSLRSLTLSSPMLSVGLPPWLPYAVGLTSLLLHGGRLALRFDLPSLACLHNLNKLQTLSFMAPLLLAEEWDCLTHLSCLTELRINDWRAPTGQPTSLMLPGQQDYPSTGLDLRPVMMHGPPSGAPKWLTSALTGTGSTDAAVQPAPGTEEAQSGVVLGPAMQLGSYFPRLHTLRATLSSPSQLTYLASQPPGAGLPTTLRALHIAFTDSAAQSTTSPVDVAGDLQGGTEVATPAAAAQFGQTSFIATSEQLHSALLPAARPLASSVQQALWSGLARCCPALTELNVRRSWTLLLDEAAVRCLQQGMHGLRELQFCGAVGEGATRSCSAIQSLEVLSLGAICGEPLVISADQIPSHIHSLSLLNASLIDSAVGSYGLTKGMTPAASAAKFVPAAAVAAFRPVEARSVLPLGLVQLQLKTCQWCNSSAHLLSDYGAMLTAIAACTRLRELRLGFDSQGTGNGQGLPEPSQLAVLTGLRQLCRLDLSLGQVHAQGYPAAVARHIAGLVWLRHLRLSMFQRKEPAEGSVQLQDLQQDLCSLAALQYLQTLELEVLSSGTAAVLHACFSKQLPNCRLTLVVDNFAQQLEELDEHLSNVDQGDVEPIHDEQEQAELEQELEALNVAGSVLM